MTSRPRTRRRTAIAMACALAATLAGCTGVPGSSAPRTVESIGVENRGEPVPGGPSIGDDPRTVVTGFLDANSGDPVNHDSARKYLAGPMRDDWSDRTATIISGRSVSTEQNGVVTVRGRVVGSLSQNGVYVPQLQGSTGDGGPVQSFAFRIGRSNGQNRIVDLPAGLVLTTEQFGQAYSLHGLYFFDQSRHFLVPDPRWSALQGGRLYGWLVGQLANGPRPELSSALTNDTLPSQANARRITATDGNPIKVEVPGASQLDSRGKRLLAAQVSATVSQIDSDQAVELTDGGQSVRMPDRTFEFSAREAAYPYSAPPPPADVFYLRAGEVVRDTGGPLEGKLRDSPYFLNSIAVSQATGDEFTVAGVSNSGGTGRLFIGTQDAGYRATTVRGDLSRPAWLPSTAPGADIAPEVWIGAGSKLLRVVVSGNRASASTVSVNASAGGRIVALRLSPEGARIALVIEGADDRKRLFVGAIVRNAGQVRIDALPVISPEGVSVDDVGWIGPQKLIAVGSIPAAGDGRIFETDVDGSLWAGRGLGSILPGEPDSIAVAVRQLAWVSTNNTVWRQAGRSWSAPGKSDPTTGTQPVYLE